MKRERTLTHGASDVASILFSAHFYRRLGPSRKGFCFVWTGSQNMHGSTNGTPVIESQESPARASVGARCQSAAGAPKGGVAKQSDRRFVGLKNSGKQARFLIQLGGGSSVRNHRNLGK